MQHRHWLAPVLALLLLSTTQAQLRGGFGNRMNLGTVHIHVILANDRSAGPYLLVLLMAGSSDAVVGTSYTNEMGKVDFVGIPIGDYRVRVSGDGIQTIDSDTFEVDNRQGSQAQYVTVNRTDDSGPKPLSAHSTTVSAHDLNVPPKARKELDKANESMAMLNWKKALEHLNNALALDPKYATAYNNLGVFYAKMNDLPHEEEALKKALSLDDHFAPALVNYGKLCLRQKNFPQAETLLEKAVSTEPNNTESLMLLADAQYMNRHFDAAIVSARQAHSVSKEHPSFAHYIAARAYQQGNRQQEALTEFQLFLKEEPKGPRADHVRGDIAKIQGTTTQAQRTPE